MICAVAIVALVLCTIGAGLFPLYRARAANLAEVQRLHTEIATFGDLSLSIGRTQGEIAQAETRLHDEEAHLPSSQAMDQFITELAKVAEDAGLQVDAIAPAPPVNGGTYRVLPVKVTGFGSYQTCCKFLSGLRNMTRLTRLDELQLQARREEKGDLRSPVCEITITISTFVVR